MSKKPSFFRLGINILFLSHRYKHEKIADNFAAMYGYGAELTTALGKMETTSPNAIDDFIHKISGIRTFNCFKHSRISQF